MAYIIFLYNALRTFSLSRVFVPGPTRTHSLRVTTTLVDETSERATPADPRVHSAPSTNRQPATAAGPVR